MAEKKKKSQIEMCTYFKHCNIEASNAVFDSPSNQIARSGSFEYFQGTENSDTFFSKLLYGELTYPTKELWPGSS